MRIREASYRTGCRKLADKLKIENQAIQPFARESEDCYNEDGVLPSNAATVKTVAELKVLPVWVNPDHAVSSARVLMAGHGLKALGVVELKKLVGVVTPEQLAGMPSDVKVSAVMMPASDAVQKSQPVRDVAEFMAANDLLFVPVLNGDDFVGILTATMLLRELERAWDPLTGLCWSDLLREWGVERLMEGREVTIIFIDLDEFRNYNKNYGHAVGDLVLQEVAATISQVVEEGKDIFCRYGGDEFAVGTIRSSEEAQRLADEVERRIGGLSVPGGQDPVTVSVGVFGGRRTRERENIHFAATLDSLINLASKACLAKKVVKKAKRDQPAETQQAAAERSEVAGAASEKSFSIAEVYADDRSAAGLTTVILSVGESVISAVHARGGLPVVESIAKAAAKAIERALTGIQVVVSEVRLTEQPPGTKAILVAGRLVKGGQEQPISAVLPASSDVYRAAAEAVVSAVEAGLAERP